MGVLSLRSGFESLWTRQIHRVLVERTITAGCKPVAIGYVGSNPTGTTKHRASVEDGWLRRYRLADCDMTHKGMLIL
jgi:hypothetical protein